MTDLRPNEYIEDLQFNGLQIILSSDLPSFTTDAVLLSDFARVRKIDHVADLGAGTGILLLLMHGRYKMSGTGFEIEPALADMSQRSFELNGLSDSFKTECIDCREAYRSYNGAFSAAVCNPPYFADGISAKGGARALARSQVSGGLSDFLLAASRLLKSGGKFFCCYPADRLTDILFSMRNNGLEPKRIRFVRSFAEKSPYLVLVEAKKDGGAGLSFQSDLIIHNPDGTESAEICRIYHRD